MYYQGNALKKRNPHFWLGFVCICIVLLTCIIEVWGHDMGEIRVGNGGLQMMSLIPVICTCIGGCLILIACAFIVYWTYQSHKGVRAAVLIFLFLINAYIVITGVISIIRIYYDLPPLPWEIGDLDVHLAHLRSL